LIKSFPDLPSVSKPVKPLHRLEPRARSNDINESLEARVRDPLWLLTRQWQMGEFQGEDAGSPIQTRLQTQTTELTRVSLGKSSATEDVSQIDRGIPLEVHVERETPAHNTWTSIQIGRHLERELRLQSPDPETAKDLIDLFRNHYPITGSLGQDQFEDSDTREYRTVVTGRVIDGNKLLEEPELVAENPTLPVDLGIPDPKAPFAVAAIKRLYKWYLQLYPSPGNPDQTAWQEDRMEYEFKVSASWKDSGQQIVATAKEYTGVHLDWYSFSLSPDLTQTLGEAEELFEGERKHYRVNPPEEFVPTPVTFSGMPNTRWWEFEDGKTDFGKLEINKTDLSKLWVMEFALIYGNDWFLIPVPLPVGSLCRVHSLQVKDVFGDTVEIRGTPESGIPNGQCCKMFNLSFENYSGVDLADPKLQEFSDFYFLSPTLPRSEKSPALEEVLFFRDEMANMVWGVEKTVTNGLGQSVPGYELFLETRKEKESLEGEEPGVAPTDHSETPAPANAKILYRLSSSVPDNWIPFIPVRVDSSSRTVQLQRAQIVRNTDNLELGDIESSTRLLGNTPSPHRIFEETVTRTGLKVQRFVQRTRWTDGSTHIWIGKQTGAGRGEGSSGLKFDFIEE